MHTHIDYVGGLDLFPRALLVIAAAERMLPRPLYRGDAQRLSWPERESWQIREDIWIDPCFEDLLAPGHALGQLTYLLDLPQTRAVLMTSDAISRHSEPAKGFSCAHDGALACFHAERMMLLAAERKALVICGHRPEQWPALRKALSFYG